MQRYRSVDEALAAFDRYVRIEPRLAPLWDLCGQVAPPSRSAEVDEDADPFQLDPLAAVNPDDGWCAEDWFRDHVKSRLLLLAGDYRPGAQPELHSREAFEDIYGLLLDWALYRPCTCCAAPQTSHPGRALHP